MTVYIYYNPFTRPSGPSGQWPMNGQSSLIEGKVWTAYGKWWMIMIDIEWDGNMLGWTFNHVIIPYQYVSIQSKHSSVKPGIQGLLRFDLHSVHYHSRFWVYRKSPSKIIRSWSDERFQTILPIMTSIKRTAFEKYRTGPFDAWVKPVWRINLTKIKQKTWVRLAPLNLSFFQELQFCPI